jgi:hypothetical protein
MTSDGDSLAVLDEDPNTQLRLITHRVRVTASHLENARMRKRLSNISLVLGPVLGIVLFELYWLLRGHRNLMAAVYVPGVLLAAFCVASWLKLKTTPGGPPLGKFRTSRAGRILKLQQRESETDLELRLAQLRDERKMIAGSAGMPIKVRRIAYRDDTYEDVAKFRVESARWRRVNNLLQGILIVGSLGATIASSTSGQIPDVRWVTVGITFAVGVASGFMGYFKYKERSFYLQETADSIESEWEAADVGIGHYAKCNDSEEGEKERLELFVAEVHRLKSEQKKRQQNLEQPPDSRNSPE